MNPEQRLLFFTFVLVPLAGMILFCVGCSADLSNNSMFGYGPNNSPANCKKRGQHYLKLSEQTEHPALALENKLRAAESFIQAKSNNAAGQILKDIQTQEPNLALDTRNTLIQARLALIKNDHSRALKLIQPYLNSVSDANTNLKQTLALKQNEQNQDHNQTQAQNDDRVANSNANGPALRAKKIALLLPSKGPHANAAKTIRDGFLAGFYKADTKSSKNNPNNDPKTNESSVQVYDTADGSQVIQAYEKALADKAEIVVGPLTKPEVDTLATIDLPVPVLALNTLSSSKSPKKLYQFGLLPEDEVAVLAQKAYQTGHRQTLIYAPKNEWGERMVSAFKETWKGKIIDIVWLNQDQDLTETVRKSLEQDQWGRKFLRKITSEKNKKISGNQKQSEHAPRTDIDMIFLAANPELARQVKPLLSYFGDPALSIYASASVYTGIPAPGRDQDLEGIHFCDMPWVLNANENIRATREKVANLWPASYNRSPRYFALGMDAYKLANHISESSAFSSSNTQGMTGNLYIDSHHRVQRSLTCAKFVQGLPVAE